MASQRSLCGRSIPSDTTVKVRSMLVIFKLIIIWPDVSAEIIFPSTLNYDKAKATTNLYSFCRRVTVHTYNFNV